MELKKNGKLPPWKFNDIDVSKICINYSSSKSIGESNRALAGNGR